MNISIFSADDSTDESRAEEFEGELATVREDLVDSLSAWVLKTHNHPLKNRLLPNSGKEPVIAFFRNQIPVLYDGRTQVASSTQHCILCLLKCLDHEDFS